MRDVTLATLAQIGAALAHPGRLRILALLREGALYVCPIRTVLGFPASTVSVHLAVLRRAGLVGEEKFGRWIRYRLTSEEPMGSMVREILHLAKDDPHVIADADLINAVRRVPVDGLCRAGFDLAKLGLVGPGCRRRTKLAVTSPGDAPDTRELEAT